MEKIFHHQELGPIVDKVVTGKRLSKQDGLMLLNSTDLLLIGALANQVRERKNQDNAYFISNRHINHTNVCVKRCKLCAFGVDKESNQAYLMSLDEVADKAREASATDITELHIVGGLHHDLPYEYYLEMIKRVRNAVPHVHIKAFTAVEIDHFSQLTGRTIKDILIELREAGLGSLPGGGAEVFSSRVRNLICEKKISGEKWLEVHETAHRIGMRTNATMLYGHVETPEEIIDHLISLREVQDRTGGFQAFIPLAFHPQNTGLADAQLKETTGFDDLRILAVSRLMLDNFDHIKAYWVMIGPKLAQVSLAFGVDDIDGTIIEEKITHAAGAKSDQALTREQLVRMIKAAGRVPKERNTLYQVVREDF